MTAAPPQSPVIEGLRSLEVRWILPGQLRAIRKKRRVTRFPLASTRAAAAASGPATGPACAVELTEIRSGDQAWWSLGFEATGPAGLLSSALQGTAGQIFALGQRREPRATEAPKREDVGQA